MSSIEYFNVVITIVRACVRVCVCVGGEGGGGGIVDSQLRYVWPPGGFLEYLILCDIFEIY